MERAKRPYSIQKRVTSKKNRSICYVGFRDSGTAQHMTAVSSGKSSKSDAMNRGDEQIESGRVIASDKRNISFEAFAKEFWDWDKSPYMREEIARGLQIGHTHVRRAPGRQRSRGNMILALAMLMSPTLTLSPDMTP